MAERQIELTFDGPALEDGTMAVRDLAPSLLALGDLLQAANGILQPDEPPVGLNIRATDRHSYHVILSHSGPGPHAPGRLPASLQ